MEPATVAAYEANAVQWRDHRSARFLERAARLAGAVVADALVADLGCGAGLHLPYLPRPAVGLDAAAAMVRLARNAAPEVPLVRGDLECLPFRHGALGGAWARASYLHVPRSRLPWALMELHRAVALHGYVHLTMMIGDVDGPHPDDRLPGRVFTRLAPETFSDLVTGAGFDVVELVEETGDETGWMHVLARRARTLPDFVGPGMRLLVCGLNPSLYAADRGVGFARPGNRFWPAALAAGIVSRDRDPVDAYRSHAIGMTDLAKRATTRADELTRDEYRSGAARVEELVRWLRPRAICFVGLAGYRMAVERKAAPGVQGETFAGVPAYVMPNTSGLNARVPLADLVEHLRAAAELADAWRSVSH